MMGVYGDQYPSDILKETPAIRAATGVDIEKGLKDWQTGGAENKITRFYAVIDLAKQADEGKQAHRRQPNA